MNAQATPFWLPLQERRERQRASIMDETVEVFWLKADGEMLLDERFTGRTQGEAIDWIASGAHKSKHVIRCTEPDGNVTLHIYQIKAGKRVAVYHDYQTKMVAPQYAEWLHDIQLGRPL